MPDFSPPPSARWLCHYLYVGRHFQQSDRLIAGPIAELAAELPVRQSFFIRYTDQIGPHLRFRVLVDPEHAEAVNRQILRAGTVALDDLSTLPPPTYTPLVSFEAWKDHDPLAGWNGAVEIVEQDYDPEYEVYGGPNDGMRVAEAFFCGSSELAIEILKLDLGPRPNVRKTLAPCLADRVLEVFKPQQGRERFLRFYSTYWVTGSGMEQLFQEQFELKMEQLRAEKVPVISRPERLSAEERSILERWEALLKETERRYRTETETYDQTQRQKLAFNFMHLMNNRLGLGPADEAYLAGLMANVPTELEHVA